MKIILCCALFISALCTAKGMDDLTQTLSSGIIRSTPHHGPNNSDEDNSSSASSASSTQVINQDDVFSDGDDDSDKNYSSKSTPNTKATQGVKRKRERGMTRDGTTESSDNEGYSTDEDDASASESTPQCPLPGGAVVIIDGKYVEGQPPYQDGPNPLVRSNAFMDKKAFNSPMFKKSKK